VARRVTVPAADDIFRPTVVPQPEEAAPAAPTEPEPTTTKAARTASGRVKHDEKMTVYVTADELLDIEHARLELRRHHGLAVDRGRLVRAAVALALADLDAHGAESPVVQRLQES
jgi:hypothetical protein